MATYRQRGNKGMWLAEIRRKGYKPQCKSFSTKAEAKRWAESIEGRIAAGAAPDSLVKDSGITVGKVIAAYRRLRDSSRPISDQSNEHYQLKKLESFLGEELVVNLTPERLAAFCVQRREEDGAGPYTCNMDISKLGTILRMGSISLKVQFADVVGSARPLLSHLRLIGGANKRHRRPTEDELARIMAWLAEHKGARYAEVVAFAEATAMRQGEISALKLSDINFETHVAKVWRKHPRLGKKLHEVPILGEAWAILNRQQPEGGRPFPIHGGTMSKYFTEACVALSIPDLHFHDLRHEGATSLFEAGFSIEQVALVTGHEDWRNLKRYTNLRPEDLTRREHDIRRGKQPHPYSPQIAAPHQDTSVD